MKQLEIKTNKRLLIVELPDDQEARYKEDVIYKIDEEQSKYSLLPKGEFILICKGSELTEEILWKDKNEFEDFSILWIESNGTALTHRLEAFISAIESKGYHWENPLGVSTEEIRQRHGDASDMFNEWLEYEKKTFNPSICLIFEIL
ncbi:hypothetical protein [Chryseobacterium arthrosphaerae]|uniref:hypothetical protein n=1 Tax=Chryseobacterium arthrosphaerae TaxID=651561 RepID=UPI003D35433D